MLLRNLRPQDGLCNGTRLICTSFHDHLIGGTIISGSHTGSTVFIHRVPIIPTDLDLPFALKRLQFPVRPAFAMTINKSQGQTLNTVGIYLRNQVFSHGQLYVALSRVTNSANVHVLLADKEGHTNNQPSDSTVTNVVYPEILQ